MLILITTVTIMATFMATQAIASRIERRTLIQRMDAIRKEENERFIKAIEAI